MRKVLFLSLFVLGLTSSYGQLNNYPFEDRRKIEETDSGKLFLGVNALGFVKDNEYDTYRNPIVTGYTLFGYQFNPYLSYSLSKHIRLDAGVYLQKDFGNSSFATAAPIFTVKYQRKNFSALFGNLEGSLNHRLIEPLYNFERVLNNRLENGLQVNIIRDDLFFDTWIDWKRMIYFNDPGQEQLTAGMNLTKRIIHTRKTQVFVPLQFIMHHKGGEINYQYSGPTETIANGTYGFEVRHQSTGLIREIRISGYYLFYKLVTQRNLQPFKDGSGAYANANISTRFGLDVMGSYWFGHEFISPDGGRIYPSVSTTDYTQQHHLMKLFILRLMYNIKIADGLVATARVEPYYDFYYRSTQTSYGVYLNFKDRFFLWKGKNK